MQTNTSHGWHGKVPWTPNSSSPRAKQSPLDPYSSFFKNGAKCFIGKVKNSEGLLCFQAEGSQERSPT